MGGRGSGRFRTAPPAGRCDGDVYYSAAWIGLTAQGDTGRAASRNGTRRGLRERPSPTNPLCLVGMVSRAFVSIDNFPVANGDRISCLICSVQAPWQKLISPTRRRIFIPLSVLRRPERRASPEIVPYGFSRDQVSTEFWPNTDYGEVDLTESYAGTTTNVTSKPTEERPP